MTDTMTLLDIIHRTVPALPWAEGENLPWDDPAFSERMLAEHLSQEHDLASRRAETIDQHVRWIHETILESTPTKILDLACGPGLYTARFARLGHTCVGIDFSPASVAYAQAQAERGGLACTYRQADVRSADIGEGYGLVMMVHGQINVFRRSETEGLLASAHAALTDDGVLVLEPQLHDFLHQSGQQGRSWDSFSSGLFSKQPHLLLRESFWDDATQTCTERFHVIDAATGAVQRYALSTVAYTEEEWVAMLSTAGFGEVTCHPSLTGASERTDAYSYVLVARK